MRLTIQSGLRTIADVVFALFALLEVVADALEPARMPAVIRSH